MDAQERIRQQVTGNLVVLYMKGIRSSAVRVLRQRVQILKACGVEQVFTVNVLEEPEIRQGIKEYANWPTIPQLYVNGEFVGGFPTSCARCTSPGSCRSSSPEKKPPLDRKAGRLIEVPQGGARSSLLPERRSRAEEIRVVEHVVQVVQRFSDCVALSEGRDFRVGRVECLRKSAEQFGHCKVCFAISPIDCRIEEHRRAVGEKARISAP